MCPNTIKFNIAKQNHVTDSLPLPPSPHLTPSPQQPPPARPSPPPWRKPNHHDYNHCDNDNHYHTHCYCCNLYHDNYRHYHAFKNIVIFIVFVLLSLNEDVNIMTLDNKTNNFLHVILSSVSWQWAWKSNVTISKSAQIFQGERRK